jgi:hypothetical protein
MICLFVPFLLAIVLSVLQIMASDLPFRNFKLFLFESKQREIINITEKG